MKSAGFLYFHFSCHNNLECGCLTKSTPLYYCFTLAVFVSKMYLITINKKGESYD